MISRSKNIDLMMDTLLALGKNVHLQRGSSKTGKMSFRITFTPNVVLYIEKDKNLIFYGPHNPNSVFSDLFELDLKENECQVLSNTLNSIDFTDDDKQYVEWYVFMIVDGKKYISDNFTWEHKDTLQNGIFSKYIQDY